MEEIKIGNWIIKDDKISWNGEPDLEYSIEKERLAEFRPGTDGAFYDWPLHLAQKTWLNAKDIQDFNKAFKRAFELYGLVLDENIFALTLEEQNSEILNGAN
ncbi:MAG: hypothetical protein IPN95_23810 [Bacteroidetes bacterium]|nr:hypothetical protein [Bacteroidota bacterium]MBP8073145.1 hypothetical protein [Bacteroidia bacterium]